jgi:hypothetical protein
MEVLLQSFAGTMLLDVSFRKQRLLQIETVPDRTQYGARRASAETTRARPLGVMTTRAASARTRNADLVDHRRQQTGSSYKEPPAGKIQMEFVPVDDLTGPELL